MMNGNPMGGAPQGGNWMQNSGAYGGAQDAIDNYTGQGVNAINRGVRQGTNALNPYIQAGQNAIPGLNSMFNQFSNPQQAYNNFASTYQMSPGAQFKMQHGMAAIKAAMAQNGLGGSGHEATALSQYNQGLINEDMNSQWQNILGGGQLGLNAGEGLFRGGLNAVDQAANMYGNAASDTAHMYGQAGEDNAELEEAMEQQKAAQQAQNGQNWWNLGGAVLGAGTGLLEGGGF